MDYQFSQDLATLYSSVWCAVCALVAVRRLRLFRVSRSPATAQVAPLPSLLVLVRSVPIIRTRNDSLLPLSLSLQVPSKGERRRRKKNQSDGWFGRSSGCTQRKGRKTFNSGLFKNENSPLSFSVITRGVVPPTAEMSYEPTPSLHVPSTTRYVHFFLRMLPPLLGCANLFSSLCLRSPRAPKKTFRLHEWREETRRNHQHRCGGRCSLSPSFLYIRPFFSF